MSARLLLLLCCGAVRRAIPRAKLQEMEELHKAERVATEAADAAVAMADVDAAAPDAPLPPLTRPPASERVPCTLRSRGEKAVRSRHVDLRRFHVDMESVVCERIMSDGVPAVPVWRVTFTLVEQPAAWTASGWRLLSHSPGGTAVSGWVDALDLSPPDVTMRERQYRARVTLTSPTNQWLELVYRLESTRFWETDEGNSAFHIVRQYNNKNNSTWMDVVPNHTLRSIMLHEQRLYPALALRIEPQEPPLKRSALPLCENAQSISSVGHLSPDGTGMFPATAQWAPANCRMRAFESQADWEAVPGRLNMRLMGDSNFQFMQGQAASRRYPKGNIVTINPNLVDGPFNILPNRAAFRWRFFRGVVCGDRITSYIMPGECGGDPTKLEGRCNGAFGLTDNDLAANYTGYNSIFIMAGWWVVIYRREQDWPAFARGLRQVLLDCEQNHKALRRKASIFWVQPPATNQTAGLGAKSAWRVLWNDRIQRYDAVMRSHLHGLIDGVVPTHAITSAWRARSAHDPHRNHMLKTLWTTILNYAIWGEKRVQRRTVKVP